MSAEETSFDVFVDENEAKGVALILHGASIIEGENGELAPGCKLTAEQARRLAAALEACALAAQDEA